MSSRLDRITDWDAMARQGRYRLRAISELLEVSRHTLQAYLSVTLARSPRAWLEELRFRRAVQLMTEGKTFSYVPKTRGDIAYICRLHPVMKGTVVVR